jgi:hypothetical protein
MTQFTQGSEAQSISKWTYCQSRETYLELCLIPPWPNSPGEQTPNVRLKRPYVCQKSPTQVMCVKRDLMYVKKDLLRVMYVKRDLMYVKRVLLRLCVSKET